MKLQATLSQKSINNLIGEVKRYGESLYPKSELFLRRLIDEGIKVAEQNKGFYGNYIVFEKEFEGGDKKCVGFLIGRNASEITSYWNMKGKIKSAKISPILFAEFGSGWLAEVLFDDVSVGEVGQGTFPGQKHAFDPGGWSYMDLNGNWHHSKGIKPSHPMYKAELAIYEKVIEVAREVFASDI